MNLVLWDRSEHAGVLVCGQSLGVLRALSGVILQTSNFQSAKESQQQKFPNFTDQKPNVAWGRLTAASSSCRSSCGPPPCHLSPNTARTASSAMRSEDTHLNDNNRVERRKDKVRKQHQGVFHLRREQIIVHIASCSVTNTRAVTPKRFMKDVMNASWPSR